MEPGITYDVEKRPEASNLLEIYACLANISRQKAENTYKEAEFSSFKKELADMAIAHLAPIRKKILELEADTAYIDSILKQGADKAFTVAQENLDAVKDIVGFVRV